MSRRRDWAVAVFVVWRGALLLHQHPKLQRWLPCGGHIEADELPDDAAVREVWEESGVRVQLLGTPLIDAPGPRQLTLPRALQLAAVDADHDHLDLVYFATPIAPYHGELSGERSLGWFANDALAALPLTPEIRAWASLALAEGDL